LTGVKGAAAVYTRVRAMPRTKLVIAAWLCRGSALIGSAAAAARIESETTLMTAFLPLAAGCLLGFLIAFFAYRSRGQVVESQARGLERIWRRSAKR